MFSLVLCCSRCISHLPASLRQTRPDLFPCFPLETYLATVGDRHLPVERRAAGTFLRDVCEGGPRAQEHPSARPHRSLQYLLGRTGSSELQVSTRRKGADTPLFTCGLRVLTASPVRRVKRERGKTAEMLTDTLSGDQGVRAGGGLMTVRPDMIT